MELRFTEAILPETTPPSANFPRCNKIKVTSGDVRATIGGVELTLATVETKNGLILYRINPEA